MDMEALQPLNGIDVFVFAVLLVSALFAYFRGFVHEILSIIGWVGAAFAVLYGLPEVRPFVQPYIQPDWAADAAAGVVIFIVTLVVIFIITHLTTSTVRKSAINILDRSLGFVFGVARGVLLLALVHLAFMLAWNGDERPDWLADSRTEPYVAKVSESLKVLAPADLTGVTPDVEETEAGTEDDTKGDADRKSMFEKLVNPAADLAESPSGDAETSGYENDERRDLERLIESKQD